MTKHFPSDFYVTCAAVIPVLFLAAAVQGGPFKLLLRASMAATRANAAVSKASRRRALPAFARSSLIRITAYTIVVAGAFGEVNALTALYRGIRTARAAGTSTGADADPAVRGHKRPALGIL